jgi:hypothetical protein
MMNAGLKVFTSIPQEEEPLISEEEALISEEEPLLSDGFVALPL